MTIVCTYFFSTEWEISKLQLFEISIQDIFSIFLIGYNWSHSVHFRLVIQLNKTHLVEVIMN